MPLCRPGLRPLARPVAEDAVEHVERLAHLLRVRVRAEVDDAAAVPLAREHHARELVLDRDRDVRERLVVAQPDVERRPVALDEVLLEVERLDLGAGDDRLDVGDAVDELVDPGAVVAAARPGSTGARAGAATSPCRRRGRRRARRGRGRRPGPPAAASSWALDALGRHLSEPSPVGLNSPMRRGARPSRRGARRVRRSPAAAAAAGSRSSSSARSRTPAKWTDPGAADGAHDATPGYRALVFSSVWKPPRTAPTALELTALRGAVGAAVAGRDPADRRRLPVQRRHAAHAAGAVAVRGVRGLDPARAAGRPRRDRRQRAEPAAVLEAAVLGRRHGRRRARVPRAPRGDVRRAEGRRART